MSQRTDDKHCSLLQLTGQTSGTIVDMVNAWLSSETGVSGQTNDLWHAYWDQQLIPAGQFNDRAYDWLEGLGYLGALPDKWSQLWKFICGGSGEILVPLVNHLRQWADSENLLSDGYTQISPIVITQSKVNEAVSDGSVPSGIHSGVRVPVNNIEWDQIVTFSFDYEADVIADIVVRPSDAVGGFVPAGGDVTFTASLGKHRYSVTFDLDRGFGEGAPPITSIILGHFGDVAITFEISRFFVENVTNRASQNPSTYVPNSVSKLLNGQMHETDNSIPIDSVANECPPNGDGNTTNSGWCWGFSTAWNINDNVLTNTGGIGDSIHTKQFSEISRVYNYKFDLAVDAFAGSAIIAGQPAQSNQIGTNSGAVVANSINELFAATSGIATEITNVTVIELDDVTEVDGVAARLPSSIGALAVDPITRIVTEV